MPTDVSHGLESSCTFAAMHHRRTEPRRALALGVATALLATGTLTLSVDAASADAASAPAPRLERLAGVQAPDTPEQLNRVGVLEFGDPAAKNVLVLQPGTSASAAYFAPLAQSIVTARPDWQVWSVERRENLLEDQSVIDQAKAGTASPQRLFDYYLGYLSDPSVTDHYQAPSNGSVAYAKQWGLSVEMGDLDQVIIKAKALGGKVVLGGHSLGGTMTTAYATWDFDGRPGARGLAGLVFIDGASRTAPATADDANTALAALNAPDASPWLAFGGIPAPLAGLFATVGSGLAKLAPNDPSILQTWPLLPAFLKGPERVTNEAGYGYATDPETSPANLAAAQAHVGTLSGSGDPRPWDQAGELSPIQRTADAFFGTGLTGLDGTAWFHPQRLTVDAGGVGNGVANPAQAALGIRTTDGDQLHGLKLYAFAAKLGGRRVLDSTRALAAQSGIPASDVELVDRSDGYSHLDPLLAAPDNDFVDHLLPFLDSVGPLVTPTADAVPATPAPPAAAARTPLAPLHLADVVSAPAAGCLVGGRLTVKVRAGAAGGLKRVTVLIGGRRLAARRAAITIRLRRSTHVRIGAVAVDGRGAHVTRRYRPCEP